MVCARWSRIRARPRALFVDAFHQRGELGTELRRLEARRIVDARRNRGRQARSDLNDRGSGALDAAEGAEVLGFGPEGRAAVGAVDGSGHAVTRGLLRRKGSIRDRTSTRILSGVSDGKSTV